MQLKQDRVVFGQYENDKTVLKFMLKYIFVLAKCFIMYLFHHKIY